MYSTTSQLWKVGAQRDLTNVDKNGKAWNVNFVAYKFKDDAPVSERGTVASIQVPFQDYKDYIVDWSYDKAANTYLRNNGGVPHIDRDTGKQLTAKDVIVLLEDESQANDGYENNLHMLYGTKGTGKALFFMDGKEIKGTWSKASRTSRTKLHDTNGNEITFTRGKLWFEITLNTSTIGVK